MPNVDNLTEETMKKFYESDCRSIRKYNDIGRLDGNNFNPCSYGWINVKTSIFYGFEI